MQLQSSRTASLRQIYERKVGILPRLTQPLLYMLLNGNSVGITVAEYLLIGDSLGYIEVQANNAM